MIMTCIVKGESHGNMIAFWLIFFYHVRASILGDSVSCQLQFKRNNVRLCNSLWTVLIHYNL